LAAQLLSIDFRWIIWKGLARYRTRTSSEDNLRLATRSLLVAAVAAAALAFCGSAGAANVVIGPSLTSGEWFWEECEFTACTFVNEDLGGTGPNLVSPVTGAVVRFSVIGGATPGTYRLSAMEQAGAPLFIFKKRSAAVTVVPSENVETYATSLPITAGQTIGLSMSKGASVAFLEGTGRYARWASEPPETGPSGFNSSWPEVAGFNAEVQPAPTVTSLGVASGPTGGGTSVPISGTDFANVSGVSFGSVPAASFSVTSEGTLTAVAPPRAAAGAVSVTVTTVAGKANAPQNFTYEAPPAIPPPPPVVQCTVPNLKGKTLKAARAALRTAQCKLGKVTKLAGATPKSGKVTKQGAKAGAKVVVGTKVDLTLKPPKPAHKRGAKGKH
jgi:hypothetical protein